MVTGGFGHIGSKLVAQLSKQNIITVLDNSLLGRCKPEWDKTNITSYAIPASQISLIPGEFDYVFHLGEYSRVEQSVSEAELVFENNIGSLIPVLSYCRMKSAKLIYSGSSTKFADGGLAAKTSPYAFTKKINSEIVREYCECCQVEYAIVYFNNVYGDGELGQGRYATVVEKFLQLAASNQPLPVTLPGHQRRAFTHIDDTVNALEIIASNGNGDDFLICADRDYSILELAEFISDDIEFLEATEANRMHGILNNGRVKQLGWKPERELFEYLGKRISSHRGNE